MRRTVKYSKHLRSIRAAAFVLSAILPAGTQAAGAATCPRADTIGTARTIVVDPAMYPRVGLKSFPQTLPLADKEVVLTFDDGPFPATTNKILAALAAECVKATFFLIGRNAQANPQVVKAIAAAGHSIGNHTWSHPNMATIAEARAIQEIDKGLAAEEAILGPSKTTTRFFRFPYFASTPALLALLERRQTAVFGADLWASDWNPMTPTQQLHLLVSRLEEDRKGIILLHDPKKQTAAMVPAFLAYLKSNNYKVVHVVPSGAAQMPESAADSRPPARSNKPQSGGKDR